MIDPHVHCRDWNQSHKETIEHALFVAEKIGLSGIFDMPNTSPPINSRELVEKRLKDAEKSNSPVFYGLYIGLTANEDQIKEAVEASRRYFPKQGARTGVVGLKMFAGHSVGNLGIIKENDQRLVYKTLAKEEYTGVLAVHCEKQSLLKPELWDYRYPKTHSDARPPAAEARSVADQIDFAISNNFRGTLHICHVSVPESVELIQEAKGNIKISCGVTPHHCLLSNTKSNIFPEGLLYKVNPPLRDLEYPKDMLELLMNGHMEFIETDHAPHTLKEKIGQTFDSKRDPQYMSGFPGLPFYPHFINYLREAGMSGEQLRKLTHTNIERVFEFSLPERNITPDMQLENEYEIDIYKGVRTC